MEFILFTVVAAVVVVASFSMKNRQHAVWQSVADKLGLECVGGKWHSNSGMYGDYRGVPVYIKHETEGSGEHKEVYTVFECTLDERLPRNLHVCRQGLVETLGTMLGDGYSRVGDPELDNAFVIRGTDLEAVAAFLTKPTVKRALLQAHKSHPTLEIRGGSVWMKKRGATDNPRMLENYINVVVDVAIEFNTAIEAEQWW